MQFKGYKHVNYSTWMKSLNQNKQPLISKLPPEKVLIIYGKNDPYFPKSVLNSFQTLYPSIQNKEIDKAGHLPHMEKSSEVNSTIADFLIWVSLKDKQEISLDGAEPKICNGGQLTLSFHEGLKSYQWALNGVPIPLANTATYKATKTGDYTLKYQRQLDSTVYETSPLNVTSRETAKYIPILNHTGSPYLQIDLQGINNEVKLIAPSGFAEYNWYKDSEDNKIRVTKDNTIIASHGVGKSDHAGSYFVKVLQTSGCLSNSSRPIKISWQKQQPISPKPEPPKMTTVSPTEIRLDWKSYPNAVKYEVWRFRFESEDYGIQNWTFVKSLPASTTTYVDGGLVKAPYRYLIRALLPSGYAIFSKEPTQVTTPK